MGELLDLARDTLTCRGALCDGTDEEIEAILPPEVSARLQVAEHVRWHEGPGGLAYGGELLERLLELACQSPVACAASVRPRRLPPGSLAEPALATFSATNGVLRAGGASAPGRADYVVVDYRYRADADERHEGLVRVAASAAVEVPRLADELGSGSLDLDPHAPGPPADAAVLLACADRAVVDRVEAALAVMRDAVRRRHLRDRRRVRDYFAALRHEMEAQLARRAAAHPEERETRLAKIAALAGERERKLADLWERFGISAKVTPVAAMYLSIVVQRQTMLLRRRKGERSLDVTWSSATRAFDPLACEACAAPIVRFALCDDRLHVLCAGCDADWSARRACPACRAGRSRGKRAD